MTNKPSDETVVEIARRHGLSCRNNAIMVRGVGRLTVGENYVLEDLDAACLALSVSGLVEPMIRAVTTHAEFDASDVRHAAIRLGILPDTDDLRTEVKSWCVDVVGYVARAIIKECAEGTIVVTWVKNGPTIATYPFDNWVSMREIPPGERLLSWSELVHLLDNCELEICRMSTTDSRCDLTYPSPRRGDDLCDTCRGL